MTDPMPTIENILGFPARTNTPDHRKIGEKLLGDSELANWPSDYATRLATQATGHLLLALNDKVTALAAQLEHIHGDIGALPQSHHFAAGRL